MSGSIFYSATQGSDQTQNERLEAWDRLQFDKSTTFEKGYRGIAIALKNDALWPIAIAFDRNMSRVEALSGAIPNVAEHAKAAQVRWDTACLTVMGCLEKVSPNDPRCPQLYKEIERLSGILTDHEKSYEKFVAGCGFLRVLSQYDRMVIDSAESILSGQIVGVWTAFETLKTDLWVQCLNRLPKTLGDAVVNYKITTQPRGEEEEEDEPSVSEKTVSFWKLKEYNYDLRYAMGTLLKKRFNFNRLSSIKRAYDAAFKPFIEKHRKKAVRSNGADSEEASFKNTDRSLSTLEALRNVIVHRGGVADMAFLQRVKKDDRFKDVRENEVVLITGELAAELSTVVVLHCLEMLEMADGVLSDHSQ